MAARVNRPTPIKVQSDPMIVRLTLAGPYAGQHVTFKMDRLRRKHLRAVGAAGETNDMLPLFDIIEAVTIDWDIKDEATGEPLPQPNEGGVDELTAAQMQAIYDAMSAYNEAKTALPKA